MELRNPGLRILQTVKTECDDYNFTCDVSVSANFSTNVGVQIKSHPVDWNDDYTQKTEIMEVSVSALGGGIDAKFCMTTAAEGGDVPGEECKKREYGNLSACMPCDLCRGDINM